MLKIMPADDFWKGSSFGKSILFMVGAFIAAMLAIFLAFAWVNQLTVKATERFQKNCAAINGAFTAKVNSVTGDYTDLQCITEKKQ